MKSFVEWLSFARAFLLVHPVYSLPTAKGKTHPVWKHGKANTHVLLTVHDTPCIPLLQRITQSKGFVSETYYLHWGFIFARGWLSLIIG